MAVRSHTMRRFLVGRGPVAESILGRIALIILYSTVWAILLSWLFLFIEPTEPVLLKFAVLAAIGVGAGFLARRQLRGHSVTLSFLTALVAEIAALSVLNPITRGFLGMNLFGLFPSNPEWDGLLQFSVTGLASWLALRAWISEPGVRQVEPRQTSASPVRPPPAPVRRKSARRAPSKPMAPKRSTTVRSPRVSLAQLRQRAGQRLRTTLKPLGSILASPKRILTGNNTGPMPRRKTRPRRRVGSPLRLRKNRAVHLSQMVEHRCPYCLEPVQAKDPRGVKICEVCHTRHHADCWAVTGVCQVPHQNH